MNTRNSASSRGRAFTWHDLVAVLVLCVLSVALYRKIALTNRIMSGTDAMTYFYPYRAYAAQAIRAGRVPLWNPYLFLGVPFLANPQTAVFYPLNLVLSGLTAPKQVAWSLVIHTALASIFAYLYARRVLLLSPWAACLAAAAFGHGGYLTAQAEHVNQVNVLAWFPLLLLLWEVRRRAQWLALSGLAAVIGVGLLAGHTQASFVSLVGLALYAAVTGLFFTSRGTPGIRSGRSVLSGWPKSLFATGWQLALVVLAGFGLAAVQVLPTIELSQLSIRGGGLDYRQAVAFSLKPLPRLLRYTFLPRLWGQGADLEVLFGGSYYTEYLAYIGVVALVLALLACGVWFGAVARVRRVEKEARRPSLPWVYMATRIESYTASCSAWFGRATPRLGALQPSVLAFVQACTGLWAFPGTNSLALSLCLFLSDARRHRTATRAEARAEYVVLPSSSNTFREPPSDSTGEACILPA